MQAQPRVSCRRRRRHRGRARSRRWVSHPRHRRQHRCLGLEWLHSAPLGCSLPLVVWQQLEQMLPARRLGRDRGEVAAMIGAWRVNPPRTGARKQRACHGAPIILARETQSSGPVLNNVGKSQSIQTSDHENCVNTRAVAPASQRRPAQRASGLPDLLRRRDAVVAQPQEVEDALDAVVRQEVKVRGASVRLRVSVRAGRVSWGGACQLGRGVSVGAGACLQRPGADPRCPLVTLREQRPDHLTETQQTVVAVAMMRRGGYGPDRGQTLVKVQVQARRARPCAAAVSLSPGAARGWGSLCARRAAAPSSAT
jgi:hypothetical protein